jgi:hypothetical protein
MAVASPYAVFRAVDLGWPLPVSAHQPGPAAVQQANAALQGTAVRNPPAKRRYGGTLWQRTAPQWNTLIQGELFPS